MQWNWQQQHWPEFIYEPLTMKELEAKFLIESAKLLGASSVMHEDEVRQFKIELLSNEALKSSKIENEFLDRDSVMSSILCQFGLSPRYSDHRANDKEKGFAALMVDNYQHFDQPLSHAMMFKWHEYIVGNKHYLRDIGRYRTSTEPMQVVSGYVHQWNIHFEAPPSEIVPDEMDAFIAWFNDTAPGDAHALPALTRAGIAHLYFVSIHPFEDGNGRVARALSEKILAQAVACPALLALSHQIEQRRKQYYAQLEGNQKHLAIDAWLLYFASTVLDAVVYSQKMIRFTVAKARLFDRVRGQINQRQEKALLRMFAVGMGDFKGGLSADKYINMTGATGRTASRDLQKLVELGALTKTGKLKGTRYWLNLGEEFECEKRDHLNITT